MFREGHGLILVGPFPAEIQNYTSCIAAAMSAREQKDIARAFVRFLGLLSLRT